MIWCLINIILIYVIRPSFLMIKSDPFIWSVWFVPYLSTHIKQNICHDIRFLYLALSSHWKASSLSATWPHDPCFKTRTSTHSGQFKSQVASQSWLQPDLRYCTGWTYLVKTACILFFLLKNKDFREYGARRDWDKGVECMRIQLIWSQPLFARRVFLALMCLWGYMAISPKKKKPTSTH